MRAWTHAARSQPRTAAAPVLAALLANWAAAQAPGQTITGSRDARAVDPVSGTASIRGRILSIDSGQGAPVANARVSLAGAAQPIDPVFSAAPPVVGRPPPDVGHQHANLPQGGYYVVAVDRMEGTEGFGEWQDPAFLEAMAPRATRLSLTEGQSARITLHRVVR